MEEETLKSGHSTNGAPDSDFVESEDDDRLAQPIAAESPPKLDFPVVGIGASAGGLEAFLEFFEAMPSNAGIAFVLVQHLPPDRESMIAEIIGKHTQMPVAEVEDGVSVEVDHVYVIRPGRTMTLKDGRLHLGQSVLQPGHGRPVDDFFRSLAAEQRERAICIVMSGMGSNGSAGAEAIKAVGGVAIAQEPESAKFPSMPRHLVETGNADFVRRPSEMPELLTRYTLHSYITGKPLVETTQQRDERAFNEILAVLKTRIRRDYAGYKKPTVLRRIQRRMGLNQIESLPDYATFLRQTPAEVPSLADDLMIHVTGFFRDPAAWEALKESVVKPLVEERGDDAVIRCWVTACSSGEEAYTLAMLLWEATEDRGKSYDIKVFATDMADRSLQRARSGIYPFGIEADITPDRLDRFFDRDEAFFRVRKELREMVVFAPQNVIQDPPFSRLDICTCRNLLIYLEPEIQRRVLSLLHFGLRDGGALFLGTSETVAGVEDLFEPIDKRSRIFRRVGPTRHSTAEIAFPETASDRAESVTRPTPRATVAQQTQRLLLERYTPPAVTVDRDQRIVYFHGDTSPYVVQPPGEPTRDLMSMARENVRGTIRSALNHAITDHRLAVAQDGYIETEHGRFRIEVRAQPIEPRQSSGYYLISFHQIRELPLVTHQENGTPGDAAALEEELQRTRDELQNTIEELQTTNEEMRASNEETMSVNEELQSTNEELETSKEELQSLNEELTTVNVQLQTKIDEHETAVSDLNSLLASTKIAVIFLDTRLRIRRFTEAAKDLFEMIGSDIGRPVSDLHAKFEDPSLLQDCKAVLERLSPLEQPIASQSGMAYIRRVQPYRTVDNRIEGVVLTFVDVTAANRAEQAHRESELKFRQVIEGALDFAMLLMDTEGRIKAWNAGAARLLGWTADEAIGKHASMIYAGADPVGQQAREMHTASAEGRAPDETWHRRKDGSQFWGSGVLTPLRDETGKVTGFVKVLRDETIRRDAETDRDDLLEREQAARRAAETANYIKDQFLARLSHELRTPLASILLWSEMLQQSKKTLSPEDVKEGLSAISQSAAEQKELLEDLLDTSRIASGKVRLTKARVRLDALIKSTVQTMTPVAQERGVALRAEVPDAGSQVYADRDRLRQVLQNLVGNAIKFTPPGGIVKISLRELGETVEFKVEDTGRGIEPEFLPYIFTPFSQADYSATRTYGGLGLGLAICKELVELHGGTIEARSGGKGSGATFTVRLPTSLDELEEEHGASQESDSESVDGDSMSGMRILLVEDDTHTIAALTRMLQGFGAKVAAVGSADEAIEAYQTERPDIIVSDIGLPQQDGFELMRRLRAIEAETQAPPTPAVALSAFAGEKHRRQALESGFQMYLPKPARTKSLLETITKCLGR